MNRDDFVARLLGSATIGDYLHNLREGLEELELKDDEGNPLTEDTLLVDFEARLKSPKCPSIFITITLKEFSLRSKGMKITLPTGAACDFFNGMNLVHEKWHEAIAGVIGDVFQSLMTENEKILSETMTKNLFHRN